MIRRSFPALLLYGLGFLLLWEWLRPIEQLTNTSHVGAFIIFLLIAFALSFLHVKWFWQAIIQIVFILFSINRFHYQEPFFQLSWLGSFMGDIVNNLILIGSRDWTRLSNEFRTLLLFILLWLMVYLVHYWLLRRQRIFLFFFMTLIYITVLDTFTVYNAGAAIIRTIIAGFAVMGTLTYFRIIHDEKISPNSSFLKKWMIPLTAMIALSVLIGIAAPKAAPIWPDPVPYLKTAANKGGEDGPNSGISRIGYGTNDERLGGPFIGDDSPVFQYEGYGKTYWKVETKDVYTGKGWVPPGSTPITFWETDLVPVYSIPNTVETAEETAHVTFNPSFFATDFMVYPLGIEKFEKIEPSGGTVFNIDTTKEKITSREKKITSYSVQFKVPKYKADNLRKTTVYQSSDMGEEFYERYTQLPEELPQRIKQLTEEITAGKTNWFDKAKAVEEYFGKSEYIYDQKNVALPKGNTDYVDQFLFETKTGYCDNFSSSMAVMLRTIGIPTRWVKGFTGGDFIAYSQGETSMQLYQVSNNNAHSWVEVYLPGQGWVQFEPTKGFSNGISIDYSTGQSSSSAETPIAPQVKKPNQQQEEDTKGKQQESSFDWNTVWTNVQTFLTNNWMNAALVVILLIILAAMLYRIRGKWFPYVLMFRYRFKKKDETIGAAYMSLLSQLDRFGIKRKESQTLRNYAHYVDSFYSTREMTKFTHYYEQYLYQQNLPEGSWEDVRKLWENLIKKTIA
ncbi:transglutaminase TgpA family protein [Neobacillus dielmonensis]|uniref:transglutaminase TgpA family protein n=1 Tax=Neobacillus dielmonensis TaxID=1347369 RepID=UPI0005AA80A4|nr:transglutaminaseTgpA domain-containing protein [Neobacillus dielmonensis]